MQGDFNGRGVNKRAMCCRGCCVDRVYYALEQTVAQLIECQHSDIWDSFKNVAWIATRSTTEVVMFLISKQ